MPKALTLKIAKQYASKLGWTINHDAYWGEYQAYPKGTNASHAQTYFCVDLADTLGSVARNVRNEFGPDNLNVDQQHTLVEIEALLVGVQ